jgi:hypothetical protein
LKEEEREDEKVDDGNREKVTQGETGHEGDGTTEKDRVAMNAIAGIFYTMHLLFLRYMNCIVE